MSCLFALDMNHTFQNPKQQASSQWHRTSLRWLSALVLATGLAALPAAVRAQTPEPPAATTPPAPLLYTYAEQMPTYRHGRTDALKEYVVRSRKWPRELWKTQGTVFVSFVVTDKGQVRDAKVIRGVHPTLDAEALRVVESLDGQFLPGRQNGQPVHVQYTLPVPFQPK